MRDIFKIINDAINVFLGSKCDCLLPIVVVMMILPLSEARDDHTMSKKANKS